MTNYSNRELTFTPGPWVAIPSPVRMQRGAHEPIHGNGRWTILPASDVERLPICEVDHADDGHPPTRANAEAVADLIAAAPDLYHAAKSLVHEHGGDCECSPCHHARAAIFKASAWQDRNEVVFGTKSYPAEEV